MKCNFLKGSLSNGNDMERLVIETIKAKII